MEEGVKIMEDGEAVGGCWIMDSWMSDEKRWVGASASAFRISREKLGNLCSVTLADDRRKEG